MSSPPFDLEAVPPANGHYFALQGSLADARLVYLPVPWDVTTSYNAGAAEGPQAILTASPQLDWYDFDLPKAWEVPRATVPIDAEIYERNRHVRALAKSVYEYLERGGTTADAEVQPALAAVNRACADLNVWVYERSRSLLDTGKLVGIIGGDHSVPLGLMRALGEVSGHYGILQIDAHCDLRAGYGGFLYSHAAIAYHALGLPSVTHLTQVGIRDVSPREIERARKDERVTLFDDWQLQAAAFSGKPWAVQCEAIVSTLPNDVYVSFDIDGLSPEFCPHTGTPVPGGLSFNAAIFLLQAIVKSGRRIVGFDLCEVSPGDDEWDGNVGARVLYKLSNLALLSQPKR
ncbi:arginase/agmatinase/formimionoglutamate hydrolase, arginase family [Rubidibacter lacunae KORDI 51-2]|uniref:Arginase/agmatinase/formimionoglutamate hydrolase, arginase family n=1 Tax=Rubidibacter lacunae KORDI 51-2 TaxID=582515 RepID=U5DDA9_9CHRO|nr:agmatinase family protein [Rubidibacter lacunae]ERN42498.1 arginase/agmatinase/formimionoglutamate hydrolase, arginase family [Rubidibacter lacunae KORDI 51-2]